MSFATLGLGPKIVKAVDEAGYTEPTPIQTQAIPSIFTGRDLVGIAQTGTGKTAAFVLPILQKLSEQRGPRSLRALIVAPTRELVLQIEENLRDYAKHVPVKSVTVYGGVSEVPQINALRGSVDIVVATPGRLIDLMDRGLVKTSALQFLVLDEADRMLDMGFLPSIRRIIRMLPAKRQTMLFSATLSKEIEKIASDFLTDPATVEIGRRATPVDTVTQMIHEVPMEQKPELLLHLLRDRGLASVLIFSRTKHGADRIARRLGQAGMSTATIHSNRSQAQRQRALQRFRSGEVRVLVATDIAARGIDVDGISHVINYDFPQQPDDYVHRIGRTGRATALGEAISFVTPQDYLHLRNVESLVGRRLPRYTADGFTVKREEVAPMRPVRASAVSSPVAARSFGPRRRSRV
jgi:ATP-dependent RNA helicase RhlE